MRKPNSKNVQSSFYNKIEAAFEQFEESAKDLARGGDERSDVEGFDFEGLQTQILKSSEMTAQHRNQLLSELRKKNKEAGKIDDLISDHQKDMEQHASGSLYHQHLADLEAALGM